MEGMTPTGNPAVMRSEPLTNSTDSNKPQVDDDDSDFYNTTADAPVDAKPSSAANDSESATPLSNAPLIPGLGLFNMGQDSGTAQTAPPDGLQGNNDTNLPTKPEVESTDKATENDESNDSRPAAADTEMKDTTLANGVTTGQKMSNGEREEHTPEEAGVGGGQTANDALQTNEGAANGMPDASAQGGESHENNVEMGDHPEWEIDSSPYESSFTDSSSDSSSDDSDDDEDNDYALLDPEEQARILMQGDGGSDHEGDGKGQKSGGAQIKSTNERPEEIVPKPDVTITPEMKIEFLGKVEGIVGNVALIKANTSGEYQVLEMSSVLCLENREVVGVVSETLGQVQQPLYTVRFPNVAAVEETGLKIGTFVYYVVSHSTFVFTQPLKGLKGSDASNFHDEEAGEDEIEFSDDEAEAAHKRQVKQKKQERKEGKIGRGGHGKPGRGNSRAPSNLSTVEMNYDDGDQDGYTRLVRPNNLHEMMGQQEAPMEMDQAEGRGERAPERGSRGRGRGGFDRGRGRGNRGKRGGGRYMHQQPSRDDHQQQQPPPQSSYDRPQENPYQQPPMNPLPAQPFQSYNNAQFSNNQSYPPQQQFPQSFPFNNSNFLPTNTTQQFSPPGQFPPQQNAFPPPGSHINPAFFPMMQQLPPQQQQSHSPNQNQADPFAAAQAQLDLLKRLSGYAGGSGPQGGQGNSG